MGVMARNLILAIDVGGTRTSILVYDYVSGRVEDLFFGKPCKLHDMSLDMVKERLSDNLSRLDLDYESVVVSMGVAGLDTRYDVELWEDVVVSVFPRDAVVMFMHDVVEVFYAGGYGEPCISVIAGTGFNAYASNVVVEAMAGNWGWKVGDEASAYRIGVSILNLVFRFVDGRGGSERVYREVLSWLNLSDWEELLHWIYSSGVGEIAGLAKLGCGLVDDDSVRGIFDRAVMEALKSVQAVSERVGIKGPVNYTGGLFRCEYFREKFVHVVEDAGYKVGRYIEYPIIGALVKAFKEYFELGTQEVISRCLDIEKQIERLKV